CAFSVDKLVNTCYTPSVKIAKPHPIASGQALRQLDNPFQTIFLVSHSKQKTGPIPAIPARQFSRTPAALLSVAVPQPSNQFLIDSVPIRIGPKSFAMNTNLISNRQSISPRQVSR